MSENLVIELVSHGSLVAIVTFFLKRTLDHFDKQLEKMLARIGALELFEARTDERHDAEDRAGGVVTRD